MVSDLCDLISIWAEQLAQGDKHNHFDAIVVGAGYIGSSVAYHLSRAGLKTAIFDQGSMAAGASRANYGNIQIQDLELQHSVPMIQLGQSRFATLEEELDWDLGLRKLGGLLPIENENQWTIMAEREKALQAIGIQSELIPAKRLQEVEPCIDPSGLLGGLYHLHEGQLDPFQLINAYLTRGRGGVLKNIIIVPSPVLSWQALKSNPSKRGWKFLGGAYCFMHRSLYCQPRENVGAEMGYVALCARPGHGQRSDPHTIEEPSGVGFLL